MSISGGMAKEDAVHIHNGILLSHNKEWNNAICSKKDGLRAYHTKWGQSDKEKYRKISHMWNLKNDTNEFIYKTETVKFVLLL